MKWYSIKTLVPSSRISLADSFIAVINLEQWDYLIKLSQSLLNGLTLLVELIKRPRRLINMLSIELDWQRCSLILPKGICWGKSESFEIIFLTVESMERWPCKSCSPELSRLPPLHPFMLGLLTAQNSALNMASPCIIQCIRLDFAVHADREARYRSYVWEEPHALASSSIFLVAASTLASPGSLNFHLQQLIPTHHTSFTNASRS